MRITFTPQFTALATALVGMAAVTTGYTVAQPNAATSHAGTVTIRRTEYGIPHIEASDYRSLGYGEGYAFAQDNPCALVEQALTLAGDRSRWFGPTAAAPVMTLQGSPPSNLISDLYYRAINSTAPIQRLLDTPPPLGPTRQVRDIVAGYVDGYNRYLHDQGIAHLPDPTCRGAAWMRPVTTTDVWRRAYQLATGALGGTGTFMPAILAAAPPATAATLRTLVPQPPGVGADPAPVHPNTPGSNALALGRDATRDHTSIILANPHGPWTGPNRFYEMQLTIPGQLDVAGVTFYGVPLILPFGHTSGLAITATRASDTQYTIRRLTLTPDDSASYLVDGTRHAMTRRRISVQLPDATTRSVTLYQADGDPIIQIPGSYDWTGTTAYALHDAQADNLRTLNELLAIDQAEDLNQLHSALRTYQALPNLNIFAVDGSGTADYADASVVPHLTDTQAVACITPRDQNHFLNTGEAILDGSRSACQPGTDRDAVVPGIFSPQELPHLSRADYVANSNDAPWLINPDAPLDYPHIVGRPPATMQSIHHRQAIQMINQRRAGTDGPGAPGFTPDTLAAVALGAGDYLGEQWRDDLVDLCRTRPVLTNSAGKPTDVRPACDILARWDLHANLDSRGEVLFREFINALTTPPWAHPFDPTHPLTTPSGLNTTQPQTATALADAVTAMTAAHLPLDTPLGAVQRITNPHGPIPLHGCSTCYDTVAPNTPELTTAGVYPDIDFGASFLSITTITNHDPRTRTILTYGESENPTSAHHWDQAPLFSAKHWITERFTPAEIASDPHLTTITLTP